MFLPCDGIVDLYGPILPAVVADRCFAALLTGIPWQHDEVVMFGRRIVTARQVAWYGEVDYAYSGTVKPARPWTDELRELKEQIERRTGESFNSCLLNLYRNGGEGMGWHSDDEGSLVTDSAIASLSLGAARKFSFKHKRKSGLVASTVLEHGSLLVMRGETQRHWLHALPKTTKVTAARINLTFRKMRN